jgi:hypothetical protein
MVEKISFDAYGWIQRLNPETCEFEYIMGIDFGGFPEFLHGQGFFTEGNNFYIIGGFSNSDSEENVYQGIWVLNMITKKIAWVCELIRKRIKPNIYHETG